MAFGKLQAGCHVPFTEEWLPSGHSTIKAWLMECCRDGWPSGRFSHLHRGTLELCQSDHRVLGHLPYQGPRLLSLVGRPSLGRVLVVPNLFHLKMMEATVFLGTFNAADIIWYPSPDLCLDTILSWRSTDNFFELMAVFFTVYCGTLYRQMCAFPNHVQSIELTTGGLQSSCRNIARMIMETGCIWAFFWV